MTEATKGFDYLTVLEEQLEAGYVAAILLTPGTLDDPLREKIVEFDRRNVNPTVIYDKPKRMDRPDSHDAMFKEYDLLLISHPVSVLGVMLAMQKLKIPHHDSQRQIDGSSLVRTLSIAMSNYDTVMGIDQD